MSETPRTEPAPRAPMAKRLKTRWPGLVWAVPIAAVMVVAYLGLRALADQGVDVVVTFKSAAGAKVGDTQVVYQGLTAGRVTKIALDRDGQRVDMTLRLDRRATPVLTTTTKFWLIGAKPSLADIDSVKAALAGVTIGMAPGVVGGQPARRFIGLEQPPIVPPGTPGTAYELRSHLLGPIKAGSAVLYHGQEIGKVVSADFTGLNAFRMHIFVYRPFDGLIRPSGQFWTSSPFQVSLSGAGISTNLAPADTVLTGAVDYDVPDSAERQGQAPAGTSFVLFKTQGAAQQGLEGPQLLYTLYFRGPAGDLADGAPVSLLGFQVGEVHDVQLMFDARTGQPFTAVAAALYPRKLGVADPNPAGVRDPDAWRGPADAKLNALLAMGYRAELAQTPPLIGGRSITLAKVKGKIASAPRLQTGAAYPIIPSETAGADIDDLTSQADQILRKVNAIPIEAIGQDVRQITDRMRTLVSSPALTDSLNHLDSTLTQVDQMVRQVKPQVGPLVAKLNQTADQLNTTVAAANNVLGGPGASQDQSLPGAIQQLTEAARSIRSLSDYLGRHPEAILKGKK